MGIFDFATDILGDELFDPRGGGTEQATTQLPEQRDFLTAFLPILQQLLPQALSPVNFQAAGASPLQQQGFGGIGQLGQQGLGIAQQGLAGFDPSLAQGFLGQAGQALQRGLQPVDTQAISDAFAPSRQLALNTFQQDIIPNLLERFGASSGGSGALQSQLSRAGGNLSLGLAAQQAPFAGQAALQAPGIQQAGAGLAGNLAQLPGQLAGQAQGIGGNALQQLLFGGGIQRGIAGEQLQAQQQTALQPQSLLAAFGPLGLGVPGFENIVTPPGPSFASQLAQLGGAAASFA